jgi:hypothetical protein
MRVARGVGEQGDIGNELTFARTTTGLVLLNALGLESASPVVRIRLLLQDRVRTWLERSCDARCV